MCAQEPRKNKARRVVVIAMEIFFLTVKVMEESPNFSSLRGVNRTLNPLRSPRILFRGGENPH